MAPDRRVHTVPKWDVISRHERALYEHYSIHDSTYIIPVDARTASYFGIAILSRSFGVPTVYSCTICDKQLTPPSRAALRARAARLTRYHRHPCVSH